MHFLPTDIPEILLVEADIHEDDRGFFMETYHEKLFFEAGISTRFVQDNYSGSRQGTLRGLHYQIKLPQAKLVRVVIGEIFDVAVDLRRSSPTFGKYVSTILSADNKKQLLIPEGFAHGFYVLSEWAEFSYKASNYYAPQWERTVLWNDSLIGIEWPLLENCPLILTAKDARGSRFDNAEVYN
jgi:dTDP-4-dehydrorhamnose 3,5-epimerase